MLILCANSFLCRQFGMFPVFASSSESEAFFEIRLSIQTLTTVGVSVDVRGLERVS